MTQDIGSYLDVRERISTGDVVYFSGGTSLASRFTELVTGSPYFHVGIAFWIHDPEYRARLMLLEAHPGGRRIVSLSSYKNHPMDILRFENTWDNVCDSLLENTGSVAYGYSDYISIGLKEILGLKKHVTKTLASVSGEVCSELVSVYLNACGIEIPTQVSPGEQFRKLKALGIPIAVRVV